MMNATAVRRLPLLCVMLVGLVLAGCRSYGDDYGNTEETVEQLLVANEQFAEALQRARADFNLLQDVAARDSMLRPYAAQWSRLLLAHEAILDENRELAARVVKDYEDDYRTVHRVFGAILSEQRVVQNQYDAILRDIAQVGDTTQAAPYRMFTEAQYSIAPVYYEQVQSALEKITMRQALRSALGRRRATEAAVRTLEDAPGTPQQEQER